MDKYLQTNSSYNRLWMEYNKYGSLIVAVDLDCTLYDFHKDGSTYEMVRQLVRDLKKIDCFIIIWTANEDIKFVNTFLFENKIPFDTINENAPFVKFSSRKIYYNVLIDDRSGISQVYKDLTKLVKNVRKNKLS